MIDEREMTFAEPTEPAAVMVPATLPPVPLILANPKFLAQLEAIEATTPGMIVDSAQSAQSAALVLQRMTRAGTLLNKTRLELKRPFIDINKSIDDTAKGVARRIDLVKAKVKYCVSEWTRAEKKRLDAIEAERQGQLAKLEAKRLEEEAEAEKKAALIVAESEPIDDISFEDAPEPPEREKTATEKEIEKIKYAPAAKATAPSGLRNVCRLRFLVDDVDKLPDQFVIRTPNERMIRELHVTGWKDGDPIPVIPGVKFTVDRSVTSTGKGTEEF